MKLRIILCTALLFTSLAASGSAATYDAECFSLEVSDPLFELSATRKSMQKYTYHNGNDDKAKGYASSAWEVDYNTVQMDFDEPLRFDDINQTIESLMTLNQTSSTCFNVSVALYDVSMTMGRVLWGACEPVVSSQGFLYLSDKSYDGLSVPDLSLNLIGGVDLTCGLEPWGWVGGGLGLTTEFIIERSSYRRLKRALRVTLNANAEAGAWPFGVVWEWDQYYSMGEVVSAYSSY